MNLKKILVLFLVCLTTIGVSVSSYVYASGYILMEASSKRVIEGLNINSRYLTASIAKIMTAIVVIENCDIDGYLVIEQEDINQVGSAIYMEVNDVVKVRDLLYGLMLRSGNDCAYALARYVCGNVDDFVKLMNDYAKIIGMKHSTFANPSGLDEETQNYSTPFDMALLMVYAMENPVFRTINNTSKHTFKSLNEKHYLLYNKHKLINAYDYIIGGKTGYTVQAKRTLVTYASKNGMEFVVVTFNCGDDWNSHLQLFNSAFSKYTLKTVFKSQVIKTHKDYKVTPFLDEDIILPLLKSEEVSFKIYLLNEVDEQKVIGKIEVFVNNNYVLTKYIYRYY